VPRRGAQRGGGGGEDGVVAGYPEEQGSCHFRTGREPERRCATGSGACRMGGWLVSFGSCFDAIWTGLASMVWAVPCCCCGLPSGVTQTKTLLHAQLCSGLTRDRVWPGLSSPCWLMSRAVQRRRRMRATQTVVGAPPPHPSATD
jgi:hypothetical protein